MMSYAAGLNTGMADEVHAILKELETDPTVDVTIALYNPVLLDYVMEAAEHKKRNRWEQKRLVQQKCEILWNHMRYHPSHDVTITSDPISYSITLKLCRSLDEATKAQEILESMEAAAVTRSLLSSSEVSVSDNNTNDMIDTISVPIKSLPPNPSLMHYNTALNAWAKSTDPQSGDRAMALVRRWVHYYVDPMFPLPLHKWNT
jgi:hypothetical protein